MAVELEGLIAHLLTLISCAGEQGCPVHELLRAIGDSLGSPGPPFRNDKDIQSDRAVTAIWKWLVERSDVSVGHNRKYNHLPLQNLLDLLQIKSLTYSPQNRVGEREQMADGDAGTMDKTAVMVSISETTMWEALTGHGVDHKRIPRSEWILLLGIASSKSNGILQGDLGRLVDQDKRSVPKRTDSLVKKGYISKRTTLIRGTKTSKLWARTFAPPSTKEDNSTHVPRSEINTFRHLLAKNLEPVAWRSDWAGQDIDYTALATTIMAVIKEWEVIRVRDLKAKLGVLGMRWQMKIVSKTCRFLNSRGAIQFVAAKLDSRVFKDCIKFHRDMTPDDWSIYLATGKRSGKACKSGEQDGYEENNQLNAQRANNVRLSICPPWALDKPLPHTIARMVQSFGDSRLSNPDIYSLTLGASFNRFISSMTGSLSTADIQPQHLKHLQISSEHVRTGKIASYLFSLPQNPVRTAAMAHHGTVLSSEETMFSSNEPFGFSPATAVPSQNTASLTRTCRLGLIQNRSESIRQRRGRQRQQATKKNEGCTLGTAEDVSEAPKPRWLGEKAESPHSSSLLGLLRLRPQKTPPPTNKEDPSMSSHLSGNVSKHRPSSSRTASGQSAEYELMGNTETGPELRENKMALPPSAAIGRGRGRRQRLFATRDTDAPPLRPWRCEKCGGSWKNDAGLRYHVEKSKTPCNPSYNPPPDRTDRKGKRLSFFRPRAASLSDEIVSQSSEKRSSPTPGDDNTAVSDQISPVVRGRRSKLKSSNCWFLAGDNQRPEVGRAPRIVVPPIRNSQTSLTPASTPGPISQFDLQHPHSGVLLREESNLARQVSAFKIEGRSGTVMHGPLMDDCPVLAQPPPDVSEATLSSPANIEIGSQHERAQQKEDRSSLASADKVKVTYNHGRIGKTKPDQATRDRICGLIEKMLDEHNGVVLGGKPLWHKITASWTIAFAHVCPPTERDYQLSVKSMLTKKSVAEHWHVFRDRKGLFTKCQLILRSGVNPFAPESLELLEEAKNVTSIETISPQVEGICGRDQGQRVRGRRLLAKEVAILDAPVYAAQVAAKRTADIAGDKSCRPKRLKYSARSKLECGDDFAIFPESPGPRRIKFATNGMGGRKRSIFNDQADLTLSRNSAKAIQFLEPNTYLDHEPSPALDSSLALGPADPQLQQECTQKERSHQKLHPLAIYPEKFVFHSIQSISGNFGVWPEIDIQEFDRLGTSFTIRGWIPDGRWFRWADFVHETEKRYSIRGPQRRQHAPKANLHQQFINRLQACLDVETLWQTDFVNARPGDAGPHNIFVRMSAPPSDHQLTLPLNLRWSIDTQLTSQSVCETAPWLQEATPSSTDDELNMKPSFSNLVSGATQTAGITSSRQFKTKRVPLVTRALTTLPTRDGGTNECAANIGNPEEVMAAFIAVRSLLGGADKAIDWGLLLKIFPKTGLANLRRFWVDARKGQAAYISNFTRVFQDRLISALAGDELPMIDFEHPTEFDWGTLIQWTMQLPRQEGFQLPGSIESLGNQYSLEDAKVTGEDWREKYFHVSSSFFARYEAVTSQPAAITVNEISGGLHQLPVVDDVAVARSWIKSLCCSAETGHSVEQVKSKFLELSPDDRERRSDLFKAAVTQLTQQRVICRSQKLLLGSRPYRLNDWYMSMLARMSHSPKYDEAAAFKGHLDSTFRRHETMTVPYTLNDGAMMALTNMSAAGRIRLMPIDLPNIPLGFEPGNYESRKYPKSYYYFALEVVPTETYEYNEDIEVLHAVTRESPPTESLRGELPQWVSLLGQSNTQRWSEMLGAFCFSFATRGSMTIEGICSTLHPLLDEFEARLITGWGQRTGVLTAVMDGLGITVGEWWWLAVPWLRRRTTTAGIK